jgi:cell division protein FtsI/penicillin-binding protein 2
MVKRKPKNENLRLNILMTVYGLIIGLFLVRLFSIQIIDHGKYTALAQSQYWNLSVIPAKRGDIISNDGIVLAGTQTHYLLYAEPKKISNSFETAHKLAQIFTEMQEKDFTEKSLDSEEAEVFDEKIAFKDNYDRILADLNRDLYWVILKHDLSPKDKEALEAQNIEGIGFEEEPVRYYPEKTLSSHVLGFVAFNEQGEKQGYFGIEGALNEDLEGKPGRILEERDALGNPILVGSYKKSEPIKGRDIILSIDRSVQYVVEKKLKEGVEDYDAKSGTVIVMDPYTGEIVAMANYPTYQPDVFNYEENENVLVEHRKGVEKKNIAIAETYEPGSVIKPLTISAAIELGKVTPQTTFEDRGPVQYSDYVIDNWDGKHHGTQTIVQLLEKSNNIGAAWVGHLVGAKQLAYYFKEFGLGEKTGVELEGEDTGVIHDYREWADIDTATAAFGQGISATPLQVLNAFNVIANGGFLLQPKIVDKIVDQEEVIELPTRQVKRVISKQTSETMVDLLESAADSGEAKYFVLKNYQVAGKTGTAQIPVEGEYDPDKTNATFAGFLSGSRKFSMIVKLEEPRSSIYAAETAAPLWMDITKELVKLYGVPPDKEI